jgi:hypothetical protein
MPKPISTTRATTSFLGATRERMRGNAEAIETHGMRFLSRYGRDLTSDESDLCRGIEV